MQSVINHYTNKLCALNVIKKKPLTSQQETGSLTILWPKTDCNGVILTSFKTMTNLPLTLVGENWSDNNFSLKKNLFFFCNAKEIKNSQKSEYTDIWTGLSMLYIPTEINKIICYTQACIIK